MHFPKKFEINKSMEILGLEDVKQDKEFVLNEISLYLFGENKGGGGKKTFDYSLDYRHYFIDFLKLGINLNTQNITWWEFITILESLFEDETSNIVKVMRYRNYKKPSKSSKIAEQEEHKYYLEKQKQYALPIEQNNYKVDSGLGSLFGFVESKARKE